MEYTCSICEEKVEGDLISLKDHTEKHIIDLLKADHPDWVEDDGICQKCLDYYKGEIDGSTFKDAACALRRRKVKGFFAKIKGFFQ